MLQLMNIFLLLSIHSQTPPVPFVGLASEGKDIVFRLIIEYSCLKDFDP